MNRLRTVRVMPEPPSTSLPLPTSILMPEELLIAFSFPSRNNSPRGEETRAVRFVGRGVEPQIGWNSCSAAVLKSIHPFNEGSHCSNR